jgi:hypothetical protein
MQAIANISVGSPDLADRCCANNKQAAEGLVARFIPLSNDPSA